MSDANEPLASSSVVAGRYQIHRLLGQGGMSRVYLATDLRLNVQVAIKENLQGAPEAREQFTREAQILAHLSHTSLPRVSDHFDDPVTGRQYLVMDYVEGEDLNMMVKRVGRLPEATAVAWIQQVLDAVEYLHSQNPPVIHRDIKPSNIKITPSGKAVLVDFGLAKTYEADGLTMTGARSVTPGYAPPEQYGQRTDARSDIYALGATLYTLVTGRVPPESTLRISNLAPLVPPRQVMSDISSQVEMATLCALDVDTQRRWQSATAFRAALTAGTFAPAQDVNAMTTPAASLDRTTPAVVGPAPAQSIPPATPAIATPGFKPQSQPTTLPEVAPRSAVPPVAPSLVVPSTADCAVPQLPTKERRGDFSFKSIALILAIIILLAGGGWLAVQALTPSTTVVVVPYPTDTPRPIPSSNPDGTITAQILAIAVTRSPSPPPTATPTATLTPVPTGIPLTLTATPLPPTATSVPPTATRARPTNTRLPPSVTPTPVLVPTPSGPPIVAVVSLRIDPADTRRNQQVTFYVTFRNTFTVTQQRRWAVWVYLEDQPRKAFWRMEPAMTSNLPLGDSEWASVPTWCPCGPGGPQQFILYVKYIAADGADTPVPNLQGNTSSFGFTVNP